MKLLVVTTGTFPVPAVKGGAIETLLEVFLEKNERDKHSEITVMSIYNQEAEKIASGYEHTQFQFIDLSGWQKKISLYSRYLINRLPFVYIGNSYIAAVSKYLKQANHFDCVIIENRAEYGLYLKKQIKGKLVLHLHNDFLNNKTQLASKKLAAFDGVYALSEFVRQRVLEIDIKAPVYLLHNGIDTMRFNKELYPSERELWRKKWGVGPSQLVLLYAGRLVAEKGVKELVEAYLSLPEMPLKFVIVGSPTYGKNVDNRYLKELLSLDRDKRIIFTGYLNYKKMPEIYAASDIGVVPSTWDEPFALTVIEQMATGNPVIISDSGGMLELVTEEEGLIVKRGPDYVAGLAKAINKLATDEELRNTKGNQAKIRGQLFDSDDYYSTFVSLLQQTLKKEVQHGD